MADLSIRVMQREDASAVASLSAELGYPAATEDIEARWDVLSFAQHERVLVAVRGAEVIGFAHVSGELGLTSDPRAMLKSLVLTESCRGQGLGAQLLAAAEAAAAEMGFARMRLGSQIKRADAHRFYQRHGFAIIKSWHVFDKALPR